MHNLLNFTPEITSTNLLFSSQLCSFIKTNLTTTNGKPIIDIGLAYLYNEWLFCLMHQKHCDDFVESLNEIYTLLSLLSVCVSH